MSSITKVLCSTFSPCGNYLLCGLSSGKLCVWRISDYFTASYWDNPENSEFPLPLFSFEAHANAISAMRFVSPTALVTASDDILKGWDWNKLTSNPPLSNQLSGISTSLRLPAIILAEFEVSLATLLAKPASQCEINAVDVDVPSHTLYLATGDSNALALNLDTIKIVNTFSGHNDYLHCLKLLPKSNALVTGSEDNTARIWDVRTSQSIAILDSRKFGEVSSPDSVENLPDSWVSCLDVDSNENWLALGNGIGLISLWYIGLRNVTSCLPHGGSPQTVKFYESNIYSGGTESLLYKWTLDGKIAHRYETSATSIYSISVNESSPNASQRVMISAGTSSLIDVFTSIGHKSFSLKVA